MTTRTTQTPRAEAAEAREDLAARLERLARRVRLGTTQDITALDAAYSVVVKLAWNMRDVLGTGEPLPHRKEPQV